MTTNSFPGRNSLRKVVGSPALIDTGHSDVISKDAAPSETNTAKSEVSALQPASPANSEDTTAHTSIAPSLKSVAAVETADSDLPANTVNSNATIEPQAMNVLADVLTVHDNDAIRGAPQVVDNTINSTQSGAQAAIVSASEGVAPPQDEGDTVCGAPHGITSNNATIIDSAQSVTVSVTIAPALKDEQASKIADETPPLTIYQPPVLKQEGPLLDLATASILSVDKLIVDAPSSSSEALPASRECKAIAPASLDCSPAPSDNPLQPHSVLTAPVALPAAPRVSKPRGAAFYDGLRKRAITSAVAPPENTGMRSPCVERQSLPAPVSMPHVSLAHVSRNAVLLDTDSPAPAGRPRLTSPSAIALASPARSAPCRTPDATRAPHTPSRLGSPYDRAAQAARFAVVSAAPVGQAAIDVCPEWGSSNPSCWDVYPASDVPSSWPPPPSVDVPPTDIMSALVEVRNIANATYFTMLVILVVDADISCCDIAWVAVGWTARTSAGSQCPCCATVDSQS